jgi:hypothetical protein
MQEKSEKEKRIEGKLLLSNAPTSSTNNVRVFPTKDQASVLIQLISDLPDNISVENHRSVLANDTAKLLIESLSKAMDYYPEKPKTVSSKLSHK